MNQRTCRATARVVRAAAVAALYTGLSLALPWISFGPVQFRVSEALAVLPLFFPEAVIGLGIGCAVANAVGSTWIDVVVGAPTTLLAAVLTWLAGRAFSRTGPRLAFGTAPPILLNAITVPIVFLLTGAEIGYWFGFGTVLAGQLVCILGLGVPLYLALARVYRPPTAGRRQRPEPQPSDDRAEPHDQE